MTLTAAICAVDIGTSEIRAALVSESGQHLSEIAFIRSLEQQQPTFNPEELWSDVVGVLRFLVVDQPDVRIKNVSVTCHIGQVILNGKGVVLTDVGGWADTRGANVFQNRMSGSSQILHTAGKPSFTGGAVPLLCWLKECHPELYREVHCVLAPKDFINFRLTGSMSTDPTSAAYTFGYDVRKRAWDYELISRSGLDSVVFPKVISSTEIMGQVTRQISEMIGLPEGTPVVSGAPDGTLGAAVLIGVNEGVIADIAGTTDVVMRVTKTLAGLGTQSVVINPYIVPDCWSYGGSTGLTGGATAYWSRLLGFENVSSAMGAFGAKMDSIPAGSEGLMMSPFLSGSRFPTWNPDERGAIWGLDTKHGSAHLLKASYESASFAVREAVEQFPLITEVRSDIYLGGGIVRSKHIVQMRADILGRKLFASTESNLSLQGAAVLGLTAEGIYASFEEARATMKSELEVFVPDETRSQMYDDLFETWRVLRKKFVD